MKVILLDRDGTVIRDPEDERIDTEEKIELFPGSIEALKYLADHDFERINGKVLEMLAPSRVTVLKTYMCPHSPEDNCECRKPKPRMILEALKEFDLKAEDVFMVGDRESDVMAGINAGTKTILVKTANVPVTAEQATYTASNLLDAVKYAVAH